MSTATTDGSTTRVAYKGAARDLLRLGSSHATGPSLAAMYARLVSWHCSLDGPKGAGYPTIALFAYFMGFADDRTISAEARRMLANPAEAAKPAFADVP